MKFNKQIFTILILVLLVSLAAASEHVTKEKNTNKKAMNSFSNIWENPVTPWSPVPSAPVIDSRAYVHPQASVIGNVAIGANVMVSPMASVRGDEGMPIFVGDNSNIQDGVVLHALETTDEEGETVEKNLVDVEGKKYAVYVGENVSLAHGTDSWSSLCRQ